MSEPKAVARKVSRIAPGLVTWSVRDDRIGFRSEAFALVSDDETILIDPLPLAAKALESLGNVRSICLTASCHQRSAWRYRARFGAKVYAPSGAVGLEERPDVRYRKGAVLPGGLRARHAPGPTEAHFAFHLARGRGVLFCADLLLRGGKRVRFIDSAYQDAPEITRRSVRALARARFGILCFDHGAPLVSGARAALRRALAEDRRPSSRPS